MRAAKDRIQLRNPGHIFALQDPRFAQLYSSLHRFDTGGEAANDNICGWNYVATELQLGFVFDCARHQEALHSQGGIVADDGPKVVVHHAVAGGCVRKVSEAESIQIDCGVDNPALGKDIRGFGEDSRFAGSHRARNDQQRFRIRLHHLSIVSRPRGEDSFGDQYRSDILNGVVEGMVAGRILRSLKLNG